MSTGKIRIIYYSDTDGEEKVWSEYASRPEPENIPCSSLELPPIQQEQPWSMFPSQASQDPAEQQQQQQQTQASAEQPAEKKMNRKRGRSVGSKPERKQRRSVASKPARKRDSHTIVSYRRPTVDLLEQSPQVLLRHAFFLNNEKSRYVSVGFYPARFYYALIEFGGAHLLPVIINEQHLIALSERLPMICEAMCRGERYTFRDGVFRLLYTGVIELLPEYV
jgi:hypothetical protein